MKPTAPPGSGADVHPCPHRTQSPIFGDGARFRRAYGFRFVLSDFMGGVGSGMWGFGFRIGWSAVQFRPKTFGGSILASERRALG